MKAATCRRAQVVGIPEGRWRAPPGPDASDVRSSSVARDGVPRPRGRGGVDGSARPPGGAHQAGKATSRSDCRLQPSIPCLLPAPCGRRRKARLRAARRGPPAVRSAPGPLAGDRLDGTLPELSGEGLASRPRRHLITDRRRPRRRIRRALYGEVLAVPGRRSPRPLRGRTNDRTSRPGCAPDVPGRPDAPLREGGRAGAAGGDTGPRRASAFEAHVRVSSMRPPRREGAPDERDRLVAETRRAGPCLGRCRRPARPEGA